jgi:peptidoglycan/LPS O-acetylase OafA/YrhL
MTKLQWIDALRGFACFSVLVYHTGLSTEGIPTGIMTVTMQGESGVQLFYLISAFTLFLSMSNRKKVEESPTRNFFIRRLFRIAPMFYLMVLYGCFRYGIGPNLWVEDGTTITIPNLLSHLVFLNGWNPYWINNLVSGGWSIAIEMQFYLLVPFLFSRIHTASQAVWITIVLLLLRKALSFVLTKAVVMPESAKWSEFIYYWLPSQMANFTLGFVLYFLFVAIRDRANLADRPWGFVAKTLQPLLLLVLAFFAFSTITHLDLSVDYLIKGIGFVAFAIYLHLNRFPLLVNSLFCYLGEISYSAYLLHFEVVPLVRFLFKQAVAAAQVTVSPTIEFFGVVSLALAATAGLATLTYRWIEVPGINAGRRLIAKLEARDLAKAQLL